MNETFSFRDGLKKLKHFSFFFFLFLRPISSNNIKISVIKIELLVLSTLTRSC